jgi:GMP reductase
MGFYADFEDVMIVPTFSHLTSRKDAELTVTYNFLYSMYPFTGVPIVASNMDGVGTPQMAEALASHGMLTCLTKSYTSPAHGIRTFGLREGISAVEQYILQHNPEMICLDVANGYMSTFVNFVHDVRAVYNGTIIAGNVVTPSGVEALTNAGADIVKIGIGSGSMCTTRLKAGVGVPQLTAIITCAEAHPEACLMSDGGCRNPGDVVKAFAAGASFVMLGGMLAGHTEGGHVQGDPFYGMSSHVAMEKHYGGVDDYRTSEGRVALIDHKGSVHETVRDILGGLRSGMSYIGARTIPEIKQKARFIYANRQVNHP